ncbi:uncharacterized protein LOC124943406 [Impatiens glandulifera]|uniref:uncharacterized protein LOC124943406 n=1 Tax=Impatiens glandulifera TaxID=253017 RepID=UPI001FB0CF5E|nr:uncharacterized protein LOC124943406 [Impatiens glandulifera]
MNKRFDKTPYELLYGRIPTVSYFRVFGCKCFIHNNGKDYLTAFDAKANVGIMLGYSSVSKAFRVYNNRTQTVEESFYVICDESFANNYIDPINIANILEATSLESYSEDEVPVKRNCSFDQVDDPIENQLDVQTSSQQVVREFFETARFFNNKFIRATIHDKSIYFSEETFVLFFKLPLEWISELSSSSDEILC